jgi:hypothetical protein
LDGAGFRGADAGQPPLLVEGMYIYITYIYIY